jgi:uncharacterized protein (UPF0332 family)
MKSHELKATGEVVPLKAEKREVMKLLEAAKRLLKDALQEVNSRETRLDLAYQSILAAALATLRASGFRINGHQDEHKRILDTLAFTLEKDEIRIRYYHQLRQKRHRDLYSGMLKVSETELAEALAQTAILLKEVNKLVRAIFPD